MKRAKVNHAVWYVFASASKIMKSEMKSKKDDTSMKNDSNISRKQSFDLTYYFSTGMSTTISFSVSSKFC